MKKIIFTAFLLLTAQAAPIMAAFAPGTIQQAATPRPAGTLIPTPAPAVTQLPTLPPEPTPAVTRAMTLPPDRSTIAAEPLTWTAAAGITLPAGITGTGKTKSPYNIGVDISGVTKIKLSWEPGEGGPWVYNVWRKLQAEKEFLMINTEPVKVTAYVDAAIKTSTAYEYRIEGTDNSGNAHMSDIRQVNSAGLGLPQKPYTFKTFQNIEKVTIKWSAGTKGSFDITGYNLFRGKTPDKMEMFKFIKADKTIYDDEEVEPAIKYYYKMKAIDAGGYESEFTETEAAVPFPKPRTGLILMPSAYRNNIFDNFGLNADFLFTYYIGSIVSDYNRIGETLNPLSVILFTGDVKGTVINEFEQWPSLGLGFTITLLMQYDLGGSGASGGGAIITEANKDLLTTMYGFYVVASKKLIWENTLHLGGMSGIGQNAQTRFMSYLSPYLNDDPKKGEVNVKQSNYAYFFGFGRPLWGKTDLKVEVIVPVEANLNPLFPNYYLINTRLENFFQFDLSYFHFPGGSAILGYINFRFSVYPNPYK